MTEKRAKASCTYQDSSDNDFEILGSTQVSGAPKILQATALFMTAKRPAEASSARRHRYNYMDDRNTEDGN